MNVKLTIMAYRFGKKGKISKKHFEVWVFLIEIRSICNCFVVYFISKEWDRLLTVDYI